MDVIHKVGRRKTSVARVYLSKGKGKIVINKKDFKDYFPTNLLRYKIEQAQSTVDEKGNYDIMVNVFGGGLTGQAEAIRLAIARALVEKNPENKEKLKAQSLLTRDSRMVERKKPGQKKARKKFQFSKR
jgi:small subunit ribosomal protein S9